MTAALQLNAEQISEKLDELPSLPTIVYELSRVINDPMSSTAEVERIMSADQSLTLKVLQLANSAYYAIPGGVTSLSRAIGYIGYDAISQLVLAASIIKALSVKDRKLFDPTQFWKHSLAVGMASETIAKEVGMKVPADLFTCGLVHDMGKIAMHIVVPDIFKTVVEKAKSENISVVEAEDKLNLPRHAQVGHMLATRWKLPPMIQATIAHHHRWEVNNRQSLTGEISQAVDIVYLSNLLIHALQFGDSGHTKSEGVPKEVLDRLGLSQEKLKTQIQRIKELLNNAGNFLKIIEN